MQARDRRESSRRTSSWTAMEWRTSRWAPASSRRRIGASWARARAMATRFCSPPERAATGRLARATSSHASMARSTAAESSAEAVIQAPWWGARPIATTSRTVKPNATSTDWGTTATLRAMARRSSPATSTPPSSTRPARGVSAPESSRTSVDFPAPLGPSTAQSCPPATRRETSWSTSSPPYPAETPLRASSTPAPATLSTVRAYHGRGIEGTGTRPPEGTRGAFVK